MKQACLQNFKTPISTGSEMTSKEARTACTSTIIATLNDSGALNNKAGFRTEKTLLFQSNFGFACNVMINASVSGSNEESSHNLLAFAIIICSLHLDCGMDRHWVHDTNTFCSPHVVGNLKRNFLVLKASVGALSARPHKRHL